MRENKAVGPEAAASRRRSQAAPRRSHGAGRADMIAALQRSTGNRAVAALLQRAKLNIRPPNASNAGTISGVSNFPHRPPSNLSSQGQHLTAYVAFVDTILSNVRDRTPAEAAHQLIFVVAEFRKLPAMEVQSHANNHVHQSLDNIVTNLTWALTQDEKTLIGTVGDQIDRLLAERNRVPQTAISEHGTKGHGEAKTAGALEVMETALRQKTAKYGQKEAEQAAQEMWRLLDYDPADPDTSIKLDAIAKRVLTHLMSMRLAYPQVWGWLTANWPAYWLLPYLRKNQHLFSSLQRVSANNLATIEKDVHSAL
jgi:hypothetical protein